MLSIEQLDHLLTIYDNCLYTGNRYCYSCGDANKELNLFVYEFGEINVGLYWECYDCVKKDRVKLTRTKIRLITEQELFYLKCHLK